MSSPILRFAHVDPAVSRCDSVIATFVNSGSDKNINLKMVAARRLRSRPAVRISWEGWDEPLVGDAVCCRNSAGEILGYGRILGRSFGRQFASFVVEFSMPTRWIGSILAQRVSSLAILDRLAYISGEAIARRLDELEEIQEYLELEDTR